MEDQVKTLLDFKITKESEEKDLRAKMKKAERKMKLVREREAEVEIEKMNLSKLRKEFDNNNNVFKTVDFTDTKDKNETARMELNGSEVFKNFDCSNCPKSFQNLEDLITHFKVITRKNQNLYL